MLSVMCICEGWGWWRPTAWCSVTL